MKNLTIFIIFFLIVFIPCFCQSDEDCMACHEDSDLKTEEGESQFVDYDTFLASIHGKSGISCVDCHSDLQGFEDFPHPEKLQVVS